MPPAAASGEQRRLAHERLIREVPLLARLPAADLAALASRGKERSFRADTVVFREGDPGDSLHVVMRGRVRISVGSPEGGEATFGFIDSGDCFGDLALVDGGPRTATATAVVATRTFMVERADFTAWVVERPAAAIALLETLAGRLRRTDEALADLSFLDLPHRLAKQLLQLARDRGGASDGPIQVTQAELAALLNVTRESVNKHLRRFQGEGWITLARGAIRLDDAAALRRAGGQLPAAAGSSPKTLTADKQPPAK